MGLVMSRLLWCRLRRSFCIFRHHLTSPDTSAFGLITRSSEDQLQDRDGSARILPCSAWEGSWEEPPGRSSKHAVTWVFAVRSGPLTSTRGNRTAPFVAMSSLVAPEVPRSRRRWSWPGSHVPVGRRLSRHPAWNRRGNWGSWECSPLPRWSHSSVSGTVDETGNPPAGRRECWHLARPGGAHHEHRRRQRRLHLRGLRLEPPLDAESRDRTLEPHPPKTEQDS